MVLVKVRETMEAYLGTSLEDAAVIIPAYLNSQRQATKNNGVITKPPDYTCGLGKKNESNGEKNTLYFRSWTQSRIRSHVAVDH